MGLDLGLASDGKGSATSSAGATAKGLVADGMNGSASMMGQLGDVNTR